MNPHLTAYGVALSLAVAAPVAAQASLEVGAQAGVVCVNFQTACVAPPPRPYVSFWVDDRLGLRFRYLRAETRDRTWTSSDITIRESNRGRRLLLAEVFYSFRRGRRIQPLLGVSAGQRLDGLTVSCEPVSCAEFNARGGVRVGTRPLRPAQTVGGIAGFTVRPVRRLTIQALLGVHDIVREHAKTIEGGVLIGFLLWRSR